MTSIETLQEFLDGVLFFAMKPEYAAQVSRASDIFTKEWAEDTLYASEFGFNQWLVHNYRFEEKTENFISLYMHQNPNGEAETGLARMASKSVLSVFQVLRTQHNILLKDVLTRKDFILSNKELAEIMDETALQFLRLYPEGDSWLAVQEGAGFEASLKEALNRGVLEKYSEYSRIHGPQDIEAFIYDNPMMIYKFVEIIESLEVTESVSEEEYMVYQGTYVLKDIRNTAKRMESFPGVELGIAEDGVWIFRLPVPEEPEVQLAEIVLSENKMEVECTSAEDLAATRRLLEEHHGDGIVHMKDEVLDISSLLGE